MVGETILAGIIAGLIKAVSSAVLKDFLKAQKDSETIHERLYTTLLTISAVLIDAEEKQIKNQAVQSWLNELKDALYQAEDALDDISTDDLRKESTNLSDKVTTKLSYMVPYFSMSKFKKVKERLERLASQISYLNLKIDTQVMTHIARLRTTSVFEEQRVFGRQAEKEKIKGFLMADNKDNIKMVGRASLGKFLDIEKHLENQSVISVVAIVGIGGVGKTTLAQLMYNEKDFENHFTKKAWIYVSEEVDVFSLTKTVYESITSSKCYFTDLNILQVSLKEKLEKEKILLVLDDMWRWSETCKEWDLLCLPFAHAAEGSRIIVTTRSHHVAKKVCAASYTFTLQPLSDKECLELFKDRVRDAQEKNLNTKLEILGKKVLDKCKGLPLAAKAFGGLLRFNREIDYWRRILDSKIWTLPIGSTNILPVLRVSYHYLPPHLKRCFAYCSIFPKGYAFEKERVVLLWMAEGLVEQADNTERTEHVGDEYFSELVSRSLFQQERNTKFSMHDLINELAEFAAGEFSFKFENQIQGVSTKTRHISYLRDQYSGEALKFEVLHNAKSLRTFLPLSDGKSSQTCSLNKMVSVKLLRDLTWLRVLSLSHYSMVDLPDDIFKKMRHVRYLDLSGTDLKKLPTSICFLYNLQTLLLAYCYSLIELDGAICNLTRLKHLDLTDTMDLKQIPKHFGRLKKLQILTSFVVGKGEKISVLKDFTELRGKLTIVDLHRIGDTNDAGEANLESKTHLKEIDFTWRTQTRDVSYFPMTENEEAIFEKLRPDNQIEKLTIRKYYGKSFPAWMSDPSFSSIVYLKLIECKSCTHLPSLGGLSGLKELCISNLKALRSIGSEFYSSHSESSDQGQQPFKSLQQLSFADMPIWKEWVNVGDYGETLFPNLEKLFIVRCPELASSLPGRFPSLISFQIRQSKNLDFQLDADKYKQLQRLTIHRSCDSLATFPLGYFSSLEELEISECRLQSFQPSDEHLPLFRALTKLTISDCPDFTPPPQCLDQHENLEITISKFLLFC